MAQERKIVPNLYTSGGEFRLKTNPDQGPGEEYIGSFHYDIDEDKYFTYATPEMGLEVSQEIVPLDTSLRDDNGYLIAPYNQEKNYKLKLSRKKYEDVKDVIDTTISELAPPEALAPELTIPQRIEILKSEFADLKEHISDPDLDYLIRDSLLDHSTILSPGATDDITLSYFDIAHFGIQMKADLADTQDGAGEVGPKVLIEVNETDVFDGEVNHTDWRWYNFMVPVEQDLEAQKIKITFANDAYSPGNYDRNLYIDKIKNKPFAYHPFADNPEIVDYDSILVPEVSSSIQTAQGVTQMVQAVPFDRDNPFSSYEENVFEFRGGGGEDSPEQNIKDYFGNAVVGTNVVLYDEYGDVPILRSWNGENDQHAFAGKFKQKMWGNSQLDVTLPTTWFLSEYPSFPVEFSPDDFQIGTIKATKIDLAECMIKSELQSDSIQALEQKLEEENIAFQRRAEDAEAVSGSQAAQILSMKQSIEMMQEKWLEIYDEPNGHNMGYNARLDSDINDGDTASSKFWQSSYRPKYWSTPNGYVDDGEDGQPRMLGWLQNRDGSQGGAPDREVHGYPGSTNRPYIQLAYWPTVNQLSPQGWPNERQTIGFRMKANNYRGWPKVQLSAKGATGGAQRKTVSSRSWKTYWFEMDLGDVGVENKNIELFIKFYNNKYRRNDQLGRDRDVWISHIVREDGLMIPLSKEDSPHMNSPKLRWGPMANQAGAIMPDGTSVDPQHYVKQWGNSEGDVDYANMRAYYMDVKNSRQLSYPHYYPSHTYGNSYQNASWSGRLRPQGKLEGNSGIRIVTPANNEYLFIKGSPESPPRNKWASIYCGGKDGMDATHGIFVLPYYRYKLEFCCRVRYNYTRTKAGYDCETTQGNTRIRAGVADIRNGWRGASNPFPGTTGYAWSKWEDFHCNEDGSWKKFTLEFTPKPGPQGGTKIYFFFCGHRGRDGEGQITEWAEPRIIGPIDDTYTI